MPNPRGDFQLAIGYWFVTHKQQFRTWWAIGLLTFLGLSTVWVVLFFSIWLSQPAKLDATIGKTAQAASQFGPVAGVTPTALKAGPVTILHRDAKHIDLVAELENPNAQWGAAVIAYRFVVDGTPLTTESTFLNAAASQPVIQVNQAMSAQNATIEILTTTWKRIALAELPPPQFVVEPPVVSATTVHLGTENVLTYRVTTKITNRSVYSFLRVSVPILLKNGDTIVAVDEQTIDRWNTLTEKSITATWAFPISQATSAVVSPTVSQFDRNNLIQ